MWCRRRKTKEEKELTEEIKKPEGRSAEKADGWKLSAVGEDSSIILHVT